MAAVPGHASLWEQAVGPLCGNIMRLIAAMDANFVAELSKILKVDTQR